jgi:hypothetical protein
MYRIDSCPCCLSKNLTARWAVVAPFLAHYAVGEPPFRCKLMDCSVCSFRFFDVRLTSAEVERLYSGYRGDTYFAERHRHEFWYSRKVNDGIGGDPGEIEERNRVCEAFLGKHADFKEINSVLDYGGDRGQFIPASIGKNKTVFELSDAVPVAGVARVASEADIPAKSFDLVMVCGVLEHCSDPAAILQKLSTFGKSKSLCYVAVPYERYDTRFVGRSGLYRLYLDALLHFRPALTMADFVSTTSRLKLNAVPPLGIVKCHEHLNFFNESSMAALLNREGYDVLGSQTAFVRYPAKNASIHVLARLR